MFRPKPQTVETQRLPGRDFPGTRTKLHDDSDRTLRTKKLLPERKSKALPGTFNHRLG